VPEQGDDVAAQASGVRRDDGVLVGGGQMAGLSAIDDRN
jgi:hypothetical protein